MKAYSYINRYRQEYTFTPQEDGTILWEGDFKFSRFGWPNDYTQSFLQYVKDTGGGINLEQFKELVHAYDEEKQEYIIDRKYRELVTSNTAVINMVDPSGGPYLAEGSNLGYINEKLNDQIIDRFESVETGWKIFLKRPEKS